LKSKPKVKIGSKTHYISGKSGNDLAVESKFRIDLKPECEVAPKAEQESKVILSFNLL
jgi:hypothetical protein